MGQQDFNLDVYKMLGGIEGSVKDIKNSLYAENGLINKVDRINEAVTIMKTSHEQTTTTQKKINVDVEKLKRFRVEHDALGRQEHRTFNLKWALMLAIIPAIVAVLTNYAIKAWL